MPKEQSLHFVCVLRSGGDYKHKYVNNLYRGILQNVRAPLTFTVLTDLTSGFEPAIRVLPLRYQWKSWWSKIEMFAPDVWSEGRVWYFDLDTIITNDITSMVTDPSLATDFYTLVDFGYPGKVASGAMTWMANDPAATEIYEQFKRKPDHIISSCCTLGDQCWIGLTLNTRHFLQDKFPGAFVSFKKDCGNGLCVKTAKIVCFHGKPRPHEAIRDPATAWVQRYWM